ncbi:hypothetical protein KUTeg_010229 [Tegillarca granosa]|uniref:Uncharacterized protein n=1 Tax=Tegillarca granosa TaxID=220873 RepID=A0ABQ9F8D2_TEGGR|nr:hypothetical protein KUTeg_010229 [Tegillarca granosa]
MKINIFFFDYILNEVMILNFEKFSEQRMKREQRFVDKMFKSYVECLKDIYICICVCSLNSVIITLGCNLLTVYTCMKSEWDNVFILN